MEEARGTPLSEKWDRMEIDTKEKIVSQIVEFEKSFLSLSFTRFTLSYLFITRAGTLMSVE